MNKNAERLLVLAFFKCCVCQFNIFSFGMTQTEQLLLMLPLAQVEFFFIYVVSENSYNFTISRQLQTKQLIQNDLLINHSWKN